MILSVKLLDDRAKLPVKAYSNDAGFDIFSLEDAVLSPDRVNVLSTGLAFEIPIGYFGLLMSRSSAAINSGIDNIAGVIDSDYRGEIKIVVTTMRMVTISAGEKIAQLIIIPTPQIEIKRSYNLHPTERGQNGFGSSGK